MYDSDLERLAAERNQAYDTLSAVESFARNLTKGEYKNIGDHLLAIMFE